MKQLTCGCEYADSLILWFCDLHKHPGPESHKDGKGVIIRDLEAQVAERDKDMAIALDDHNKCVEDLVQQRDKAYAEKDAMALQVGEQQKLLRECHAFLGHTYSCPESPDKFEDQVLDLFKRVDLMLGEKQKRAGNPWAPNLDYPSKPVCSCGKLTGDNPECAAHGTKKQAAREIVHCGTRDCGYHDKRPCTCPCDDCFAIRNF